MTYPQLPDHLDSATQIMVWLKSVETEGATFARELSEYASDGSLTEEIASSYLDKFTWLTAAIDKAYEAIKQGDLDPDDERAILAAADASHEFSKSMTQLLFDHIKDGGANAKLLLKQAQDRHHS